LQEDGIRRRTAVLFAERRPLRISKQLVIPAEGCPVNRDAESSKGRHPGAERVVIPAQAGIQAFLRDAPHAVWTPACAGVTRKV
jgi:hypothetical protein